MNKISYTGYRFPPEIIRRAIWLYLRFTLSFRDVEDLLAERGIAASYETIRRWVNHFGPMIAADLRRRRPKAHTIWHLDEVYLKIDDRMVLCVPKTLSCVYRKPTPGRSGDEVRQGSRVN
jgi:putative transposase